MAGSVSAEVWLNQRRWDALEESLKAQGSNIERHLQDYLIKLYNETVPFDQWLQIEMPLQRRNWSRRRQRKTRKSMRPFIFGSMAMTASFQRATARNFWMWPYGCAIMYEEALRQ